MGYSVYRNRVEKMNAVRQIRFAQPRTAKRLVVLCGALLLSTVITGCGSKTESATEASTANAADTTSSAEKSTAATTPVSVTSSTDKPKTGSKPGVEFVRETEHVTSFPDKSVYVRKNVKVYSDNSLVPHGLYTEFYRGGQKFTEGKYVDGVKDGPWQTWYENGKPAKTENYVNGKLD